MMKLQEFIYELPKELIAQHPLVPRDRARLMVVERATQRIRHDVFSNIGRYLPKGGLIVLNDSKVIPARVWAKRQKTGGRVEILLLKRLPGGYSYEALIRPLKKIAIDEKLIFDGNGICAQLKSAERKIIRFNRNDVTAYLRKKGHMPLPPYIKRMDTPLDRQQYQTVYARHEGSVASPTAGLHFTKPLLAKLKGLGHRIVRVTLHINHATFAPVREEDIRRHRMHEESYKISQETLRALENARVHGRKIVAVGTTSCRVLETLAAQERERSRPFPASLQGETNIFIYPGFQFKMTDVLITNFHLPKSTLLMLVYAFGGCELMKKAYAEAIERRYRFYSYGDCMMII